MIDNGEYPYRSPVTREIRGMNRLALRYILELLIGSTLLFKRTYHNYARLAPHIHMTTKTKERSETPSKRGPRLSMEYHCMAIGVLFGIYTNRTSFLEKAPTFIDFYKKSKSKYTPLILKVIEMHLKDFTVHEVSKIQVLNYLVDKYGNGNIGSFKKSHDPTLA